METGDTATGLNATGKIVHFFCMVMSLFRVPLATIEYNNKKLCEICAKKQGKEFNNETDSIYASDAEFKCPAYNDEGSCKRNDVEFDEFYSGLCCESASKWLTENKKSTVIMYRDFIRTAWLAFESKSERNFHFRSFGLSPRAQRNSNIGR